MFTAPFNSENPLPFHAILLEKDQRIAALEGELQVVKEQLALLKKYLFGAKSERIVADLTVQPLLPDLFSEPMPPAPEPALEKISYQRRKAKRNVGSDRISYPDHLPVTRIELDLPESDKVCAETGEPLALVRRSPANWPVRPSSSTSSNTSGPSMPPRLCRNSGSKPPSCPTPSSTAVRWTKASSPTF